MPSSSVIDNFYWDFGNGFVPYFAVVGAYNILMYGHNIVEEAIDTVPAAIQSFNEIGVVTPIPNQTLYYGDQVSFEISEMFTHPTGEEIDITLEVNGNPNAIETELSNDILTITAQETSGTVYVSLIATGGTLNCTYDFQVLVASPDNRNVIIWDLSATPTGSILQSSIENFYNVGNVQVTTNINEFPLSTADAVFILLGVFPDNYPLTQTEAALLIPYLNNGGNVYMEGGDTWYFDLSTSVHQFFNIDGYSDGYGDLTTAIGQGFNDGMSWSYSGANEYLDHLATISDATVIFTNTELNYDCGIAYECTTYKTVGTSFEITGLEGENTLDEAVSGILEFFEIASENNSFDPPTNLAIEDNPSDNFTNFTWTAPEMEEVLGYNIYLDNLDEFYGSTTNLEWIFSGLENGQTYTAGIKAIYSSGMSEIVTIEFTYGGTDVNDTPQLVTELRDNYPNPFNPQTNIAFSLKNKTFVNIEIYNVKGEKIKTLVNDELECNSYNYVWNGTDNHNKSASSGVYFYKMKAGNYVATKKMILLK